MNNLDEVRPGRRGPHLPPEDVPQARCSWPCAGSTMHFAPAFVLGRDPARRGRHARRQHHRSAGPTAWAVGQVIEPTAPAADAGLRGRRPHRRRSTAGAARRLRPTCRRDRADHDVGDEVAFTVERDGEDDHGRRPTLRRPARRRPGRGGRLAFLGVGADADSSAEPDRRRSAIAQAPRRDSATSRRRASGALGAFFSPPGSPTSPTTWAAHGRASRHRPSAGGAASGVDVRAAATPTG